MTPYYWYAGDLHFWPLRGSLVLAMGPGFPAQIVSVRARFARFVA